MNTNRQSSAKGQRPRTGSKNNRSSGKKMVKQATYREMFEKQMDELPEFDCTLLASSGMHKNYSKSTKAIVDAQVDPTLFDSNCYYQPKIDKNSAQMAENGR